jgi:catechol 2,3-dioxygenase-like lactoylglutathione lyase family enzyme
VQLAVPDVQELRLVLTVPDFDAAVKLFRDALGLAELEAWESEEEDARIAILDARRATLELVNERQAAAIDRIEVGRRVAGPVRIAFEVADSEATAERLVRAGVEQIAEPVTTPWNDRNVRLRMPDGMQLTLFTPRE